MTSHDRWIDRFHPLDTECTIECGDVEHDRRKAVQWTETDEIFDCTVVLYSVSTFEPGQMKTGNHFLELQSIVNDL